MLFLQNLIAITLEAAPWLLLGLVVAALVSAFSPDKWLSQHLNGEGIKPVIKAALVGAPLPLCSCGVIPAALALRRSGASRRSTIAFLVATPETGVDSVSVTYGMLGPFMAIVRPTAAISSAIVAGLLVGRFDGDTPQAESTTGNSSCCSSKNQGSEVIKKTSDSCCSSQRQIEQDASFIARIKAGLKHSFVDVLNDIGPWLGVGLLLSAALKTFVPVSFLAEWGSGLPAMMMMILVGVPMYVCATASTPIAAGLLSAGISPGTALVFLLAGPATNISTLGIINREIGRRPLMAYLTAVVIMSLVFGLLTDWFFDYAHIDIANQIKHIHIVPQWLAVASAILIIALALVKPVQEFFQIKQPVA